MKTTKHGAQRAQQRGIPPMVIDLLLKYGQAEHAGAGSTKYYFDKAAHKRLKRYAGALTGMLASHLDCIAVVSATGELVTVAHRFKRIQH